IACPCAIALAAPFTLGNMLRIFGRHKFYLKDSKTIEKLAQIDTAIFDKTGTITTAEKGKVHYEGLSLTEAEESLLKNTLRSSNHPLSRQLYDLLAEHDIVPLEEFEEHLGKGIIGTTATDRIKIGSPSFVGSDLGNHSENTAVHISANDKYKGKYIFRNNYRDGIKEVFSSMSGDLDLAILSGDNTGEKVALTHLLPKGTPLY